MVKKLIIFFFSCQIFLEIFSKLIHLEPPLTFGEKHIFVPIYSRNSHFDP